MMTACIAFDGSTPAEGESAGRRAGKNDGRALRERALLKGRLSVENEHASSRDSGTGAPDRGPGYDPPLGARGVLPPRACPLAGPAAVGRLLRGPRRSTRARARAGA